MERDWAIVDASHAKEWLGADHFTFASGEEYTFELGKTYLLELTYISSNDHNEPLGVLKTACEPMEYIGLRQFKSKICPVGMVNINKVISVGE